MEGKKIRVRLKLFSVAKDLAGFDETTIEVPAGSPSDSVLEYLTRLNAGFDKWRPSLRVAVNMEYANESQVLQDGDEVAIIPPVSGG